MHDVERLFIVSPVIDFIMYNKLLYTNPFLKNERVTLVPQNNKKSGKTISVCYNDFLNGFDYSSPAWLIFCHEDFEFLEDPLPLLSRCDHRDIIGVFGGILVKNLRGDLIRTYVGKIYDCAKDGSNTRLLGADHPDLTEVETLDCQMMAVHSDTVRAHGLRFDENLDFDGYVEDFCLQARSRGLKSRVLGLRCRHWSIVPDIRERPSYLTMETYLNAKYTGQLFAGLCGFIGDTVPPGCRSVGVVHAPVIPQPHDDSLLYNVPIDGENHNHPVVLAAEMMRPGGKVFDVGSACGNNGIFFKKKLGADIWGVDINAVGCELARQSGCYERVLVDDLDRMYSCNYLEFLASFDNIYLGDVLEHLRRPEDLLKICKRLLAQDGSLIISLPNVAHAAIVWNLALRSFEYTEYGILDKTHLKFFTWQSVAVLLAETGLEATACAPVFFYPNELEVFRLRGDLPPAVAAVLLRDRHAFVCQYVTRAVPSGKSYRDLADINANVLLGSIGNNAAGYAQKKLGIDSTYNRLTQRAPRPGDKADPRLTDESACCEMVAASELFDAEWYLRTYPGVAKAGVNPAWHYALQGYRSGCNPGPRFNTAKYANTVPELKYSGINPLCYHILHGMTLK